MRVSIVAWDDSKRLWRTNPTLKEQVSALSDFVAEVRPMVFSVRPLKIIARTDEVGGKYTSMQFSLLLIQIIHSVYYANFSHNLSGTFTFCLAERSSQIPNASLKSRKQYLWVPWYALINHATRPEHGQSRLACTPSSNALTSYYNPSKSPSYEY